MRHIDYPLLLDGGLSNVLETKGCDLNHKLWTAELLISNPEAIIETHLEYLESGAKCITTSGYQASIQGLRDLGFEQDYIEELILKPVALAKEAIQRYADEYPDNIKPLIAASIGPYGAYLGDGSEYKGNYGLSDLELRYFHERRINLLDSSSADLLAIETVPSFQEARVLTELLSHTKTPAWISFSCIDGKHLCDGTPISEACLFLNSVEQVFAIGANCTAPKHTSSLIREIKTHAPSKRIIVYPNSGEVFNSVDKSWTGISDPKAYAPQAIQWINEGADIIGGCCRIGPEHIQEIASGIEK